MKEVNDVVLDMPGTQMIDVRSVSRKLGVSVVTVRRWEKESRFPAAVKLNGAVRWNLSDVDNWIASQVGQR